MPTCLSGSLPACVPVLSELQKAGHEAGDRSRLLILVRLPDMCPMRHEVISVACGSDSGSLAHLHILSVRLSAGRYGDRKCHGYRDSGEW